MLINSIRDGIDSDKQTMFHTCLRPLEDAMQPTPANSSRHYTADKDKQYVLYCQLSPTVCSQLNMSHTDSNHQNMAHCVAQWSEQICYTVDSKHL